MVTFTDGPAASTVLQLRRAPPFLRVVRPPGDAPGEEEWDALDQPEDEPRPDETVFAYRRVGKAGSVHLCVRGKGRGRSGWYATGEYAFVEPQPDEATLRETAAWRAWCESQAAKQKENPDG